jgi:selenocysteine lyase/cysteine desulfurase
MQDIGAEYYVSNMHKWMFCPSGYVWTALLLRARALSLAHFPMDELTALR